MLFMQMPCTTSCLPCSLFVGGKVKLEPGVYILWLACLNWNNHVLSCLMLGLHVIYADSMFRSIRSTILDFLQQINTVDNARHDERLSAQADIMRQVYPFRTP